MNTNKIPPRFTFRICSDEFGPYLEVCGFDDSGSRWPGGATMIRPGDSIEVFDAIHPKGGPAALRFDCTGSMPITETAFMAPPDHPLANGELVESVIFDEPITVTSSSRP